MPLVIHTQATDFALAGNPHYQGNEHLDADFAALTFAARAWSEDEVKEFYQAKKITTKTER